MTEDIPEEQQRWQLKVTQMGTWREWLSPALPDEDQARYWAFFITITFLGYYAEVVEYIPVFASSRVEALASLPDVGQEF